MKLCLGLFMFEVRRTGPREHRGELRPGIGRAHQILNGGPKLDNQVAGEVLRFNLDPAFPPQPRNLSCD